MRPLRSRAPDMLKSVAFLSVSSVFLITGVQCANGNIQPNYWFSFGDSYTKTGFVADGTLPAPGNPLGNPPYPGRTAVGGTNWIDIVTTVYNKSLVLTYNYAYGGATIDKTAAKSTTILTLTDQVNKFLNTVAHKPASTPWTSSNALFSIWIGINDINNSYQKSGDRGRFSDALLNAEFALVEKLAAFFYAGDAISLFLAAMREPEISCGSMSRLLTKLKQSAKVRALEKSVIAGFNSRLATKISAFRAAHSGVQTWFWDSNAAFTTILDSPTSYGFVDTTSYGKPGDFWGNDGHPSSDAHDIFGKEIGSLLDGAVW